MAESLYIARTANGTIPIGGIMPFDTVLFNSGGISYNAVTGAITFTQIGTYRLNWWAATEDVKNSSAAVLALLSTGGGSYIGDSPLQKGVVTGVGIFNVVAPPATLHLTNISGGNISLASTVAVKSMLCVNMDVPGGTYDTALDFIYRQLVNVIAQIILKYPLATLRVYLPGYYAIDGGEGALYSSPLGTGPGIFVLQFEGDPQVIPLNGIMAFRTGADTFYDNTITYLTPVLPLPAGWDANVLAAVHDYLSVGDPLDIFWGIGNNVSGYVYKNEYGMLVVTADMTGANPYFILPTSSLIILPTGDLKKSGAQERKRIGIIKTDKV